MKNRATILVCLFSGLVVRFHRSHVLAFCSNAKRFNDFLDRLHLMKMYRIFLQILFKRYTNDFFCNSLTFDLKFTFDCLFEFNPLLTTCEQDVIDVLQSLPNQRNVQLCQSSVSTQCSENQSGKETGKGR